MFRYAAPFALIAFVLVGVRDAFVLVVFVKEVALKSRSGLQRTAEGKARPAEVEWSPASGVTVQW